MNKTLHRVMVGFNLLMLLAIALLYQQAASAQNPTGQGRVPLNPQLALPADEVQAVTDAYYGYDFRVPSVWNRLEGTTSRLSFVSDLALLTEADHAHHAGEILPLRNEVIKVDFAADTVAGLMPEPADERDSNVDARAEATGEDLIPYLPQGEWITVGGWPALIISQPIAMGDGDGPFTEATTIIVLADKMVYQVWIGYAPPADSRREVASRRIYDQVVNTFIHTFKANANAQAQKY